MAQIYANPIIESKRGSTPFGKGVFVMGGLNSGSRAPRVTAPKPRGKANHRAKRAVTDKTAIAFAKAERARQEEARRLAEPKMVALLKVIKENRVWIAKAVEKLVAKRAAREAAEEK